MLAVQEASEGEVEAALTALLGALEHVMPAADYLKGLVILTQHDSQALRRRALRLFTSRMDSLHAGQQEDQEGCACRRMGRLVFLRGVPCVVRLARFSSL